MGSVIPQVKRLVGIDRYAPPVEVFALATIFIFHIYIYMQNIALGNSVHNSLPDVFQSSIVTLVQCLTPARKTVRFCVLPSHVPKITGASAASHLLFTQPEKVHIFCQEYLYK